MRKEKECIETIQKLKLEHLGRIIRNPKYRLLQLVIHGKLEGWRPPGRRRIS